MDYKPFTGRKRLPAPRLKGIGAAARMRDLVDVGFLKAPKHMRTAGTGQWYCDLSQCPSRADTAGPTIQSLCTSSVVFSYAGDCVLGPRHQLALQGYAAHLVNLGDASWTVVRSAVGEGMFLPSLASVLSCVSVLTSAPWMTRSCLKL